MPEKDTVIDVASHSDLAKAERLKEEGNEVRFILYLEKKICFQHFKCANYAAALELYNQAHNLMSVSDAGNSTDEQHKAKVSAINALKLILHKNRSLTRIRLEDYEGAEFDCNKGLTTI